MKKATLNIMNWTKIAVPMLALAIMFVGTLSNPAQAQLKKLSTFSDWTAYVHNKPNEKICFAIAKPQEMLPKDVSRGSVFFYITSWPKDSISNEVSVKIGYPFKSDSKPFVAVGADRFRLVPRGDKAFVADERNERKLVASMMKGAKMIIKGHSKRGTLTTDEYSLAGISAALKKISEVCK